MRHFGPVDMKFEASHAVLDTVSAPSRQPPDVQERAVALARAAIETLDGVGVYGVELFVLASAEVAINEISPRVHNAGHYSLLACASSQFEQHLRAVTGLPLAETTLHTPAAMRNILATLVLHRAGHTEPAGRRRDSASGAELYWYGKSPARLMRKLGHITALGDSPETALQTANAAWQAVQQRAEARA
jgi:5-(carboxyamino)imidazole ribonucleotide synthase